MMRLSIAALILAPSLALAQKPAAAPAAAPAKMEAPKPYAELEQLKPVFSGNWACEGKIPETPMGPAHDIKAKVSWKWELDGFWASGSREIMKSKDEPMPFKSNVTTGWDKAQSKFVFVGVDNFGGWINLTSTGWAGDKMTFEGDGMGMKGKTKIKLTFMKGKTPNEMTAEFQRADEKGAFGPAMTESCKKGK
jgi:hypothetical protein